MSQAQNVIDIAAGEVGYHEGRSAGRWNNIQKYSQEVPSLGWSNGQAWCAVFTSWVAMKAGLTDLYPRTASCASGVQWFKNRGRWSEYPAIGAQIYFGPGGGTHTGIVVGYDDTNVFTIEGNTSVSGSPEGDGVYRRTRRRRDTYVYGYGYPQFAEGIQSADPAWNKPQPSPELPSEATPFPGARYFRPGQRNAYVTQLGQRLVLKGFASHHDGDGYQPGPGWTEYDRLNCRDFQLAQGWRGSDADGYPGPETWRRLWS